MSRKALNQLDQRVEGSPVFREIFSGFALYDPASRTVLYEHEADKYYTPASNTKLFTLYTALRVLGDSIPQFRYEEGPGYTVIQGTGYPSFMHPDFPPDTGMISKLRSLPGNLYFSSDNYQDSRFGPGWSWADFGYYYQVEKSAFPIYGSILRAEADTLERHFTVHPAEMEHRLYYDPTLDKYPRPRMARQEQANLIAYNRAVDTGAYFRYDIPLYRVQDHTPLFLSQVLDRDVLSFTFPKGDTLGEFHTVYGTLPDTVLRKFMQESDNFLAEQLLLACSAKLFDGELSTARVIEFARDSLLSDLPDPLRWVDGSGLSRYNLFTPRSVVALLDKFYREYPIEWLFSILPQGGEVGTIRNWYGSPEGPYVFAKTGTLSNKHCLSGYLRTRSGRILIFSFMHNNYLGSSTPLKQEMEKILAWLRENA
jgi:D-alanyl-D-alanine carboxypeptidase/D-alanyl-D-alanine-endopeptidase (penicillin-binding protein 4)